MNGEESTTVKTHCLLDGSCCSCCVSCSSIMPCKTSEARSIFNKSAVFCNSSRLHPAKQNSVCLCLFEQEISGFGILLPLRSAGPFFFVQTSFVLSEHQLQDSPIHHLVQSAHRYGVAGCHCIENGVGSTECETGENLPRQH